MKKKIEKFEDLTIQPDDVLVRSICITPPSSIQLSDDASQESKDAANGKWSPLEIIKLGRNVEGVDVFKPGMIILESKDSGFRPNPLSNEKEEQTPVVGTAIYFTYPARIIDVATHPDNYKNEL